MFTLGQWRAGFAAFGVAVVATFSLGGSSPAQAQSACICPSGPAAGLPSTGGFCPNRTVPITYYQCTGGGGGGGTSGPGGKFSPIIFSNDALGPPPLPDNPFDDLLDMLENLPPPPDNPFNLGMHVSPGPTNPIDGGATAGGSITRASGYGITDTAGLLAPGTVAPSFKRVSGSGELYGSYDASRQLDLSANQSLSFKGFFGYRGDDISVGAGAAPLVVGNSGSVREDAYTFGGTVLFRTNRFYVSGTGAVNFGNGFEANGIDGSTGSFNTKGYWADLRVGKEFSLFDSTSYSERKPGLHTKAPPKATGGYLIGLDLSGRLAYNNQQLNGFTDSTGFIFGSDQTRYGDLGLRAKLFAYVPQNGWLWKPYVAGTVDQKFGFSSTLTIPNQAAFVGGDLVSLQQAKTFWGTQLGLDVKGPNGWTVGAQGYYQASADTNITGGFVRLNIPLNYTPKHVFATRY